MKSYGPDEQYLPFLEENAGKMPAKEIAHKLGISISKLRRLAMDKRISLRVAGYNGGRTQKLPPLEDRVKPDPFGKPPWLRTQTKTGEQ